MKPETSSSYRRIDPEGARRDYLFAKLALERSAASVEAIRGVFATIDEETTGRLGERLESEVVIERSIAAGLAAEVERRMDDPLEEDDVRGVDRIFRRAIHTRGAVDGPQLARIVAKQKKREFRPLWTLLVEKGLMEEVLARILEGRCRARYFRRLLVDLLGGASALPDADEFRPGRMVGKFRLQKRLGGGRLGLLFLAHPLGGDADMALRLLPQAGDLAGRLGRSRELLEAIAGLRHANIVSIQEIGYEKDVIFIASDVALAEPLDRYCLNDDVTIEMKLAAVRDAARALDFAHRRGVLHRDVRPSKILVGSGGKIHLTGFGLFRLLGLEDDSETLPYRAPEELGGPGNRPSDRSDVYALGIVLYELLTGSVPFEGDDERRLARRIAEADSPDPDDRLAEVDPALADIVRRAIAPRPEDRTESASSLAHDLARYLSPGSRADLGPGSREGGGLGRRPAVRIAIGVGILALAGVVAFRWFAPDIGEGPVPIAVLPVDPLTSLQRGRILFDAGEREQALAVLEEGVRAAPGDGDLHLERGRVLAALGRPTEARVAFEEAVRLAPDLPEARLRLGEVLFAGGDAASAIPHLDRFVEQVPSSGVGFFLRARAHLAAGHRTAALADLQKSTRLSPQDGNAHLFAAVVAIGEGDLASFEEFRRALRPLIERKGPAAADLDAVDRFLGDETRTGLARGVLLLEQSEGVEAVDALAETVTLSPRSHGAHLLLGVARMERDDFVAGRREFYLAIVYAVRNRRIEFAEAVLARLADDPLWHGAGRIDVDAIGREMGEDADVLFAKGLYLRETGRDALALATWERCLELEPEYWLKDRIVELRKLLGKDG